MLTSLRDDEINDFNNHIKFVEEYLDDELKKNLGEKTLETIKENMVIMNKRLWKDHGKLKTMEGENKKKVVILVVRLSNETDKEGKVRKMFGVTHHLVKWDIYTRLCYPDVSQATLLEYRQKEQKKIFQWLNDCIAGENFKVHNLPLEECLYQKDSSMSVTDILRQKLQHLHEEEGEIIILFIGPMNNNIFANTGVQSYYQECIPAFLEEELTAMTEVYCIVDVSKDKFKSLLDVVPNVHDHIEVEVWSAFEPAVLPVSCLVLHFSI